MTQNLKDNRPLSNLTMYFVENFEKGGNDGTRLELDWLTRDRSIIILGITPKVLIDHFLSICLDYFYYQICFIFTNGDFKSFSTNLEPLMELDEFEVGLMALLKYILKYIFQDFMKLILFSYLLFLKQIL